MKQNPKRYVVGIDLGTYSVGMFATEIDEHDFPTNILSAVSQIHDSGLDPDNISDAMTRLAVSGVARRTRRLYKKERHRHQRLDKYLQSLNWPIKEFEEYRDPFAPWRFRNELATKRIDDDAEMEEKFALAVRHIARHRGWRNPYSKVAVLKNQVEPSAQFVSIREEIKQSLGVRLPADQTVGQMIGSLELNGLRLRGKDGILSARLQQSDHANEIHRMCDVQGIDDEIRDELIEYVFAAESPKGRASGLVGKDPLQPGEDRALKASDAFQRYRIAALLGNLRILEHGEMRRLSKSETAAVFEYLLALKPEEDPTWTAVAELLGVPFDHLSGMSKVTDDGERAGRIPPVHATNRLMATFKLKSLRHWWEQADQDARNAMVKALSNSEKEDFDSQAGALVAAFFADLSDEDHLKLDSLQLPIGRAAYSEDTLQRLTRRMLDEGLDLYEARKAEFGIPNDWTPPKPAIGEPVGNPAVDRVLKIVARWLSRLEAEYGAPVSINIEHVRSAFSSYAQVRKYERELEMRTKRNLQLLQEASEKFGGKQFMRRSDLWRFQSVQRQNCQCAYCGGTITFESCEMDHIVPRAGQGSSNVRENLVAVCHRCNLSKSNVPFAV